MTQMHVYAPKERSNIVSSWSYTPDTMLSRDESWFLSSYPRHIARAFLAVSYDDQQEVESGGISWKPYHEQVREAIVSFTQRWGRLDDIVFLRALQEGTERDRIVAIFAVGYSNLPQVSEVLTPFLQSSNLVERYATACVLGFRHDERVLPVLEEYLLNEPVDEQGNYLVGADGWYHSYRHHIVRLLAAWGPSSFASVLRRAFLQLWEKEQKDYPFPPDFETNDAIFYSLGRRNALGAMHGLVFPEPHRRLAMIFLALGYLHAHEHFKDMLEEMRKNQSLKEDISEVLMERFALTQEESWQVISCFGTDYENRMDEAYLKMGVNSNDS
jgi:hypothetical protein